ncbi:Uncharacterised protein [Metamycoplasma cloacale]|uniref:Uncharacterized protein n=1 Tax=Metamycoplasma cloacale TaxID=92401 RepID=A0A2Z4LMK9_9BACT|nr:hypothetical protein [Metamycoplasma cloacale]AWX42960.1 hypothetical protein DK849_02725 [Metamycoplasma cloacale]VEU79216.1 Uncharacterised protein [Metamycoplasma cloacale]
MNKTKSKTSKSKFYAKLAIIFLLILLSNVILIPIIFRIGAAFVSSTHKNPAPIGMGAITFMVLLGSLGIACLILFYVFAGLAAFLTTNMTAKLVTFIGCITMPIFGIIGLAFIMKENRDVIIPTPEKSNQENTSVSNKE